MGHKARPRDLWDNIERSNIQCNWGSRKKRRAYKIGEERMAKIC